MVIGLVFVVFVFIVLIVFVAFTAADRSVLFQSPKRLEHNGMNRAYRLHLPETITPDTKLIVGLHGFTDNSRRFAYYTGLHNVATDAIVVYPEAVAPNKKGLKTGWNAGFCCGSGWVNKVDDVDYIVQLVSRLSEVYKLQSKEAYVAGFSNGSFMAQRLAAEHPDIFKAVASSSGSAGTKAAAVSPKGSVSILLMHGGRDTTIPLNGGAGGNDPDFVWLSHEETKTIWEEAGSRVEEKIYDTNGHTWNDWRIFKPWHSKPEASQRAVAFFESV